MTRNRPTRQRTVSFEALEGRLALSTGVGVASPHLHAGVARTAQQKISASFKGVVQTDGSALDTQNLRGHIGPDRLAGYGTGTETGNQFQGGNAYLGNDQGAIDLALSPLYSVRVGKKKTRTFAITVVSATGKYAPFLTSTGIITRWNVPARQGATASFSAVFSL